MIAIATNATNARVSVSITNRYEILDAFMICKYCHFEFDHYAGTVRVPQFCSNAHRQAHYRLRKNDYQRQRISPQLRLLTLRNDSAIRNAKLAVDRPSAGAGIYQQVDWTV